MPRIHALLVAIDQYPAPVKALHGCRNDLRAFQAYLEAHFPNGSYDLHLRLLEEEQATRGNIIAAFDHFQAAVDGDSCVFFFAGHGSRFLAPEAFWHVESDRMNESLVCYDSRLDGGRDLIDKELSYLIWRATRDKDVHFLAVTDCCHSGTNTRQEGLLIRQVGVPAVAIPVEDYLGYAHYAKTPNGELTPPRGRHVHLAACLPYQTAKEVHVREVPRGIFTCCLVEALAGSRNRLSYTQLVSRIGFRMRNKVPDQTPDLDAIYTADKELNFLTGRPIPPQDTLLIGYDPTLGWVVDAGALHGMTPGDESQRTELRLQEDQHPVFVTEVLPSLSSVAGMERYDTRKTYSAKLIAKAVPRLQVAIAPGSDEAGVQALREHPQYRSSDLYTITDDAFGAQYLLHARNGRLFITRTPAQRYMFTAISGYGRDAINDLFGKLAVIARWQNVMDLENPGTTIGEEEINIECYRVTEPGNHKDGAGAEPLSWWEPLRLPYLYDGKDWHQPAFRLRVVNKGNRTLWVSLLYMDDHFGINNQLIQSKDLSPGEDLWASDGIVRTIKVALDDGYHRLGINRASDYLKLFICTEPFQTGSYNQPGLKLDHRTEATRVFTPRAQVAKPDWATRLMELDIYRPFPPVVAWPGKLLSLFPSLELTLPAGMQAHVALNTVESAIQKLPGGLAGEGLFTPATLEPDPDSYIGLCVLELFQVVGADRVGADHPLRLRITPAGGLPAETLMPYGSDLVTGRMYPLSFRREGDSWLLFELPEETPASADGMGSSRKVFWGRYSGSWKREKEERRL